MQSGRNEVRWRPGKETSLASPYSILRSFGSKCTVLKKVLLALLGLFGTPAVIRRSRKCAPLHPLVTPLDAMLKNVKNFGNCKKELKHATKGINERRPKTCICT